MWNWIRHIPTPTYGRCGGASKDCSILKKLDWMDKAFKEHDEDLRIANEIKKEPIRKLAIKGADRKLAKALRKGDPKKLKLWGRIYRRMSMVIFKP